MRRHNPARCRDRKRDYDGKRECGYRREWCKIVDVLGENHYGAGVWCACACPCNGFAWDGTWMISFQPKHAKVGHRFLAWCCRTKENGGIPLRRRNK